MNEVKSATKPLADAKTSRLAIASLILGIFAFCILGRTAIVTFTLDPLWLNFRSLGPLVINVSIFALITVALTSVLGLMLGISARNDIKKRAERLKGQSLAIAGIVVSGISLVLIAPIAIKRTILLSRTRTQVRTLQSLNNAKVICWMTIMYCNENDGRFPPFDNWPEALEPYIRDSIHDSEHILTSPFDRDAGRAYAMNTHLDGLKVLDVKQPNQTVLTFESHFGSPPAGGLELLPESPRGPRGYVVGFVDGHTEFVPPKRVHHLIWQPE